MSKYIVLVVSDELKAYDAERALQELDESGSITLYDTIVVARDASGALEIKDRTDQGSARRTGIGAFVGAMMGLVGGPGGMAAGMMAGALAGGGAALALGEVSSEFLDDILRELRPGMFAVFAEASEQWTAPIDGKALALGAKVMRENRADVIEAIIERRAHAHRDEMNARSLAHASEKAEILERRYEDAVLEARDRLERTARRARERLEDTTKEMERKLDKLQRQATKASPDVKDEIEQRIAEIRSEFAARHEALVRAYTAAEEAVHVEYHPEIPAA